MQDDKIEIQLTEEELEELMKDLAHFLYEADADSARAASL